MNKRIPKNKNKNMKMKYLPSGIVTKLKNDLNAAMSLQDRTTLISTAATYGIPLDATPDAIIRRVIDLAKGEVAAEGDILVKLVFENLADSQKDGFYFNYFKKEHAADWDIIKNFMDFNIADYFMNFKLYLKEYNIEDAEHVLPITWFKNVNALDVFLPTTGVTAEIALIQTLQNNINDFISRGYDNIQLSTALRCDINKQDITKFFNFLNDNRK